MYIPAAFAEPDLTKLQDFIEQNSFGLLVSQVDGLPFASHLPLLIERTSGPQEGGSVDLQVPIIVRAGEAFIAVPENER